MITQDLGIATAYGYAKSKGYTGTEAEFAELMASYAEVGQTAVDAKDAAVAAKTAAQTAATTATNKASEATTAATTATTKAGEASTSASTATSAKDTAVSASQTATSKATEATTAAATATSAKTDAVAANTAAQSAKTAAQTAQTGAETAAASVQSSAAQIATNTEDIAQLKSDFTALAPKEDMLKAFPTDTASGAVASFADSASVPVKSLVVNIDPVQSGSGDPSPTNVRPISGWSEVNVEHTGKNLLDANSVESGVIASNDGSVVASGEVIASKGDGAVSFTTSADWKGVTTGYIPVVGNQAYNVSNVGTVAYYLWAWYDVNKNFISREASSASTLSATKTAPSNARYLRLTLQEQSAGTFNLSKIQLELGSTATAYEPYSGQSINIQLGHTVYGGTLDVTKGELVIDRTMVDLGALNWTMCSVTQGNLFRTSSVVNAVLQYDGLNIICSNYPTVKASQRQDKSMSIGSEGKVDIIDSNYSDASAFKDAMRGVQLVYELATPITVQLDPHEVRSLLGDNNVWADSGDSEVTYRADPTLYINKKIAEAISALS